MAGEFSDDLTKQITTNLYATETMAKPKYPLELLLRVITVSQKTNQK